MEVHLASYSTRNDAFSRPLELALDGPVVRARWEGLPPRDFALAELVSVGLEYAPSRAEPGRYRLRMEFRSGERIEVYSRRYRGPLSFEDTGPEFAAFASALCAAARSGVSHCRFIAGAGPLRYLASVGCAASFALVLIGGLVFFLVSGIVWVAVLKLALALFLVPATLRWLRANRPREFDPERIPAELLPPPAR